MKQKVVVEIRGGTLVGLYASDPELETHVVDWDEIAEQSAPVQTRMHADPLAAMPADTAEMVSGTVKRSPAQASA
jgi:hypothetical protein